MKVSVITPTYKRGWSLPYMLNSLRNQTIKPDEIIIVLKRSGDESENIIKKFDDLPIRTFIQNQGRVPQAYDIGLKNASGDLLLFIDDDAIADPLWIENYENFFNRLKNAGGASGKIYMTKIDATGRMMEINEFKGGSDTRKSFWRKPLKKLNKYCEGISISGFNYQYNCKCDKGYYLSAILHGANMAFRKEALIDLDLTDLFKNSHAAYYIEEILAYFAINKGFDTFNICDKDIAPVVFHIEHQESITRSKGFKNEFWKHYDRERQFYRLKKINTDVSLAAYVLASLAALRNHTFPRLLATLYAQFV